MDPTRYDTRDSTQKKDKSISLEHVLQKQNVSTFISIGAMLEHGDMTDFRQRS